MGIHKEDTKKLIQRDVLDFQKKQKELSEKLGKALEGYSDAMCFSALESALLYGWKKQNGEWHKAPNKYGYDETKD